MTVSTYVVSSNTVHGEVFSIQHYVIQFVSDLRQVGGFFPSSSYLHQQNWPPRYNWNIVESGDKHHKLSNPQICQERYTRFYQYCTFKCLQEQKYVIRVICVVFLK